MLHGRSLSLPRMEDHHLLDDIAEFSNEDIAGPIEATPLEIEGTDKNSNCHLFDWFPNLDEEPLIFGAPILCEDPFFVKVDTKSESQANAGEEGIGVRCEKGVPARPRSKRSRSGGKGWCCGMIYGHNSEAESRAENDGRDQQFSYSSSSTSSLASSSAAASDKLSKCMNGMHIKRCAHCLSHKTPQWREGPMGPKTLCNACGVRFKSGRLFPEYRPANSPTFLTKMHSSSHKKVMQMRREKGLDTLQKQTGKFSGSGIGGGL